MKMHLLSQDADLDAEVMASPADGMPRAVSGFALLCLMFLLFYAGKWGIASASHSFAMWHFNSWQHAKEIPDMQAWNWVRKSMHWSVMFDPEHGEYLNDSGRLYEFQALYLYENKSQIRPLLENALYYFRRATESRPSWPLAWANLALIKSRLGMLDEEFLHAMDQSMSLGPAIPQIHRLVSEVGLARWRTLPIEYRRKVLNNIHYGLNSPKSRGAVLANIKHYKMFDYFCKILPVSDRQKFCNPRPGHS